MQLGRGETKTSYERRHECSNVVQKIHDYIYSSGRRSTTSTRMPEESAINTQQTFYQVYQHFSTTDPIDSEITQFKMVAIKSIIVTSALTMGTMFSQGVSAVRGDACGPYACGSATWSWVANG